MASSFFPTHVHSKYSPLDATSEVEDLVHKAHLMGMPGMSLTDHGLMAGVTQLYRACKARGMAPFPGVELYLCDPAAENPFDAKTGRFHAGMFALTTKGYQGLVKLVSMSHTRPRFSRYPRLALSDLAEFGKEYGKHVAFTTGCFFGLVQQQIDGGDMDAAERAIKMYASWFPHTFVELQHHNITHDNDGSGMNDDEMVKHLFAMSQTLGLPVVAGQDSHYLDSKHKTAHELMKRMVYSSEKDNAFPGDSFHMASTEWVADHYPPHIWSEVEDSCAWLLAHNRVSIPALDKYKAHVPAMSKNPDLELGRLVHERLSTLLSKMDIGVSRRMQYVNRVDEELSVIADVGQANYFLLWFKFVNWCNDEKICIEARGSGNGSLVNFLLGITQVDPLKWGTMFERFMSRDRIKPPDIDMDIEDARRREALNWWNQQFGTVQIGNWSKLGETGDGNDRGSVLVSYQGMLRRKAQKMSHDRFLDSKAEPGAKNPYRIDDKTGKRYTKKFVTDYGQRIFAKRYGHIQTIEAVRELSEVDYIGLKQLAGMNALKGPGVHAAGILMNAPDMKIADWIPTMLIAAKETTVTQYDMDDLDFWGLMKNDILGQASLTIMRICQELMGRDNPTYFGWIPENDKAACKILREGRQNNGVFHFEGYTKARGGRELGIASTKDTVMAQALYMPGAMESGQKDLYLTNRRNGRKSWGRMPHRAYEEVLKETYGAVIFQEQPIAILRKLGMSIENINKLFKVVKDSGRGAVERNRKLMDDLRKEFDYLCTRNGIDDNDVDHAWHLVTGFINYGFNRAHAAGYGLRSYRTAYLKAHYPLEFMTALLQVTAMRGDAVKEKLYAREARRLDIRLLPPHVNVSGATWTPEPGRRAIRRGLVSITGIAAKTAVKIAAGAPYASIDDLAERSGVSGKKDWQKDGTLTGVMAALAKEGALDDLQNRKGRVK